MHRCRRRISLSSRIRSGRPRLAFLAIVAAVLVAGAWGGLIAARGSFIDELHATLAGAAWRGDTALAGGVYPRLVAESFARPSAEVAAAQLAREWLEIGTTRDGSVTVFERGSRTLYLDHHAARLELAIPGACSAIAARFPETAPDEWLQFGVTPLRAMGMIEHPVESTAVEPCAQSGYWIASRAAPQVFFRGQAGGANDVYFSMSRGAGGNHPGRRVRLAPGLGEGFVESVASRITLTWDRGTYTYIYQGASLRAAKMTACMMMWPVAACSLLN